MLGAIRRVCVQRPRLLEAVVLSCIIYSLGAAAALAEDVGDRVVDGYQEASPVISDARVEGGPIALDDEVVTDEDRVVDVAVLANDRHPDGDALRVVSVTHGANGSVLINGDDTLRYQPDEGFTGLDGFAYTIDDGHGGTATATVSVRVNDVADIPVAEDQQPEEIEVPEVIEQESGIPLVSGSDLARKRAQ